MHKLDTPALRESLRRAATTTWRRFKHERPTDPVYGFGLYTTELAEYVSLTIFSEGGLDEVAAKYAKESGTVAASEKPSLKWSPCDSPYHSWLDDLLVEANTILGRGPDRYGDGPEAEERVEEALGVFVDVLQSLDREGLFGDERPGILVSLWVADHPEENLVAYARLLNPPEMAKRFEAEMFEEERE